MMTPASCYQASPRPFPERIEPFDYPDHFKVRKVSTSCSIRWNHRPLSISRTLIGEHVAFEEIDDGVFSVFFRNVLLGRFDSRNWKLHA
jgi:putative transposase